MASNHLDGCDGPPYGPGIAGERKRGHDFRYSRRICIGTMWPTSSTRWSRANATCRAAT